MLYQLLVNGVVLGCQYALMAVGYGLIYNTTRIFHIAQAATSTVSAYCCYFLFIRLRWNLPLAIGLALLMAALLGILMDRLMYLPLYRRRATSLVFLLSSLG